MYQPKKLLAILMAIAIPFVAVASANAAGETVTAKTKLTPNGGKFFKKSKVPSRLSVAAVVNPGATSATVNPTKNIKLTFPAGMTFKPNRNVCPDSKLNSQSSLGTPSKVVNSCKKAVIGTGTALIYLAKVKASSLSDPVLVAFNAGKNSKGQPKIKIYGYSKGTGVGVLMNATLKGRVLSISVPVLSFDSAVGEFKLQIPGPVLKRPDIGIRAKGLNPRYVMASCPRSPLVTSATFTLGERDASTGAPTSPSVKANAKKTTQKCVGRRG